MLCDSRFRCSAAGCLLQRYSYMCKLDVHAMAKVESSEDFWRVQVATQILHEQVL